MAIDPASIKDQNVAVGASPFGQPHPETDAPNEDQVVEPALGEFAPPDQLRLLGGTAAAKANLFADLLAPTDTVLQSKGGIGRLGVYKELLRDDQVASTFQQRRRRVISTETIVEPGGDDPLSKAAADEFKANELPNINWDDLSEMMLYSVFYGWGMAEVLWRIDGDMVRFGNVVVRDRARFRWGVSGNLYLQSIYGLEVMPERKFWTIRTGADNSDEPYGLGLAHHLYWPVFFKRNGIKFWLIFLEKFGMPTAIAKIPAGQLDDPEIRNKAIAVLQSIATDAGVVVPDTMVVELLEAARSGTPDYEALTKKMDGAIAKIMLSQTMTTEDGSSKSQAQVHERVVEDVVTADAKLVCESFRDGPLKWWTEWNFPGAQVPLIRRATEPPADLVSQATRDAQIYAMGFEPTQEYIDDTYGKGWTKRVMMQPPALGGLPGAPQDGPQPRAPGNPGAPGGDGAPGQLDAKQFAEGELAALQSLRAARRGDQDALAEAAVNFASQYQTIMGQRVTAILNAAEDAGDYETMQKRLRELIEEIPPAETVSKLQRAGVFSRLMGALRAQR